MKWSKFIVALLVGILHSCNTSTSKLETPEGIKAQNQVDQTIVVLDSSIKRFNRVVRIDHSRLAQAEEVYTPPSIVTVFSNPEVNSGLLAINQLVGLDLPYRVLCFSEPDLAGASIAYTSSEFIQRRHGLSQEDLLEFSNDLDHVISSFPKSALSVTDLSNMKKDFGLIIKRSDYDFETTTDNLKRGIRGQGDTEIFGEIDYRAEASQYGIAIDPTTLILFGAPAPGGKAMKDSPKIGLDAFCQKLLIFEKADEVFIAYNDIVEFSELYYQSWTIPQRIVNYRLNSVYEDAISDK